MNPIVVNINYFLVGLCVLLLVFGSGLIVAGFVRDPDLRTGPNFLIIPVQLASILLVSINTIPRISYAFPDFILGEETCQIMRSIMYSMISLPEAILAFIGLQRYSIFVKRKTIFSGNIASAVVFFIISAQNIGTASYFKIRMEQFKEEHNTIAIDVNSQMYGIYAEKSALFKICPYRGQTHIVLMPLTGLLVLLGLSVILPMIIQFFCYTQIWREIRKKQKILQQLRGDTTKHSRRAMQREVMLHRSWIGIFVVFILCFIPYLVLMALQSKVSFFI